MTDLVAIKARQQQTWAQGDYLLQISADLVLVNEVLCEAVDLRAGQTVLDVATGSGNTAIAAARRWCHVIGVDYAPSMLALGQARPEAQRRWADFGPVVAAFEALDAPHRGQRLADLVEETQRWNQSGDATLVVPANYLEAVAITR